MTYEFSSLDETTAPAAARPLVLGSKNKFGFIPSPVAKAALSPGLLKHLFASFAAFESSSVSSLEQEIIAMTVAFENQCHYCMAMHSALLTQKGAPAEMIDALRAGRPLADRKHETLHQYVRAVLHHRGKPPASYLVAMSEAGYSETHLLDITLGIGVYVLSTLVNRLTAAPIDPVFAPFVWEPPSSTDQG
ncbi:MAG: carboxymuconolactone decarboxylase family protein [Polyangiaceae bacterium]